MATIKTLLAFAYMAMLTACTTTVPTVIPQPISVTTLTKSAQSWDGSFLPAYIEGQPEVTILRIVIQPGVTLNWHKHPVINAGVIISGQLRVESEQQEVLELQAGDTIVELVNKWHHGVNHGTEPVELIVFYAGIVDTPLSISKQPLDTSTDK